MTPHTASIRAKNKQRVNRSAKARVSEKAAWQHLKGQLISRFGTISAAATAINCHPNALRRIVSGECPEVAGRLAKVAPQIALLS